MLVNQNTKLFASCHSFFFFVFALVFGLFSLTFGADLADLLHVVLGAIVDGVRDSALGDSFVLAGRRRAKHGYVLHRLAQLSCGDANATCRPEKLVDKLVDKSAGYV